MESGAAPLGDVSQQQLELLDAFKDRLLACRTLHRTVETALDGARALHHAEFGNVQLLDPHCSSLSIVAQHGFDAKFLRTFQEVSIKDDSACGRALRNRQSVIVEDVEVDPDYAPFRRAAADAGYRGVQSTPLIAGNGAFIGVISTHFAQPHVPSQFDMLLLRVLARRVTDVVVSQRMGSALRPESDIWHSSPSRWEAVCIHKSDEILLRAAQSVISVRSAIG
jgi:GAF domain-containing protein